MTSKEVYSALPKAIKSVLIQTNGWLVGGALENISVGRSIKDYDIVVTDNHTYHNFLSTFDSIKLNTFGGAKIEIDGYQIDIWCEDLDHFLHTCIGSKYIYSLRKGILYEQK